MRKQSKKVRVVMGLLTIASLGLLINPAMSHHSYALYDQDNPITMTGVVTKYVAQSNHDVIQFVPLGPDGKPQADSDGKRIVWGAEMNGAATMRQYGISPKTFGAGTIFSIKLIQMRDGTRLGSARGTIVRCPDNTLPAHGKHCDSVEGATYYRGTSF